MIIYTSIFSRIVPSNYKNQKRSFRSYSRYLVIKIVVKIDIYRKNGEETITSQRNAGYSFTSGTNNLAKRPWYN